MCTSSTLLTDLFHTSFSAFSVFLYCDLSPSYRAHRIGQIRDVHIYRFVSQHTVEEALLRKANQKRSLDDLVIQRGAFDWSTLLEETHSGALVNALGEYEDDEDARAARVAAREEMQLEDEDAQDFGGRTEGGGAAGTGATGAGLPATIRPAENAEAPDGKPDNPADPTDVGAGATDGDVEPVADEAGAGEDDEEEGRTIDDYMLDFVNFDSEFFVDWSV